MGEPAPSSVSRRSDRLRIGVTVGDPAGIGPEIARLAALDARVLAVCEPVLYGPWSDAAVSRFTPGVGSAESGQIAYDAVREATTDALAGRLDAVVTAPINKLMWAKAGLTWRGHTELLAHLTRADAVAMMFHTPTLNVVLATVHVPLADVPRVLTRERLTQTIALAQQALPWFGVAEPRIAVAGLNPHAGEDGLLGLEDREVLRPAIERCQDGGTRVSGPFPGDTVFLRALRGEFDVVVAAYHDQGLIPVKLVGFGSAVNVTLGLPIVRTSVDHGTAYDIAGQGKADPSSLVAAVNLAVKLAGARSDLSPALSPSPSS